MLSIHFNAIILLSGALDCKFRYLFFIFWYPRALVHGHPAYSQLQT